MAGYRTALAVLALLSSSVAALAAPAVTLSVSAGPPTQKVTVTATGFAASTPLDIFFDTADMCLTITSATGTASCAIAVPKAAQPQRHWVTVMNRSGTVGVQVPFAVRTDMPQFHGRNARHTGVNPFENTISTANVGDLDFLWSVPTYDNNTGSPVVAGGNVYVGNANGVLFAFNAVTGATIAGFPVQAGPQNNHSMPAVAAGKVFIGSEYGGLYGFNAATGATLTGFPKNLCDTIYSSPAIANGNVYISCNDGRLFAFNITTGAAVTGFPVTVPNGYPDYGAPTIAGPNVYIGSRDGKLYAFDAQTGAPRYWVTIHTGRPIRHTMAAAGNNGFFSSDAYIDGIRLSDGGSLSGFPVATGGYVSSPAVAGNKVFALTTGSTIVATYTHGGPAWTTPFDHAENNTSPMVANGIVYVQTNERLYALLASTGSVLWSTAVSKSEGYSSPVVANGIVYTVDEYGSLFAYSVNGQAPAARLPGGALGVKPALSALKPNVALKAGQPRLAPSPEDE